MVFSKFNLFLENITNDTIEAVVKDLAHSYIATADYVENDVPTDGPYDTDDIIHAKNEIRPLIKFIWDKFPDSKIDIVKKEAPNGIFLIPYFYYLTRNGHGTGFSDANIYFSDIICDKLEKFSKDSGQDDYFIAKWLSLNDND